jgi:ribosome biogenesis protein ERB1
MSRADLDMIQRLRKGHIAEKDFDINQDYTGETVVDPHPFMPHEPKSRFVPSKWERLKVQKFLKALKEGRMKTLEEKR